MTVASALPALVLCTGCAPTGGGTSPVLVVLFIAAFIGAHVWAAFPIARKGDASRSRRAPQGWRGD